MVTKATTTSTDLNFKASKFLVLSSSFSTEIRIA